MRTYSVDLRQRIVAALDAGEPPALVAKRLAVSKSSVHRYRRLANERGSLEPQRSPGRRPRIGPEAEDAPLAQVRAEPDATLDEHCGRWQARTGQRVSIPTMSRTLRALGWTVKKSV